LEELKQAIEASALCGSNSPSSSSIVVNERQAEKLHCGINYLSESIIELRQAEPIEVIARRLRLGLESIGEIVGETATEDILARVFSKFCIGK
jgi:tRNA modification GTPase